MQNSLELNEQLKSEIQEHLDEKQKHLEKTLQMKRKELEEIETEHHLTFNKKAKFGDMFRTNSTNLQLIDCDQIVDTLANLEADCSKSLKICDTGTNISQVSIDINCLLTLKFLTEIYTFYRQYNQTSLRILVN